MTLVDEVRATFAAFASYGSAIAIRALSQAAHFAWRIALTVSAVSLALLLIAGFILGDNLFGGKRYLDLETGQVAQQVDTWMFDYKPFTDGALCKKEVDLEPGRTSPILGENGLPQGTYTCPDTRIRGVHTCWVCVEVLPGSQTSTLAPVRRFMINHRVREIAGEGAPGLFVLGFIGSGIVFLVLILTLFPMQFLRLIARAFRRLLRTLAKTSIPPRLLEWQKSAIGTGVTPVICQISDIHMTSGHQVPFELVGVEDAPDREELERRLARIMSEVAKMRPNAIALTGDLTDSGHIEEWNALLGQLEAHRGQAPKLIAAPGNHDIQILIEHHESGTRRAISRVDTSVPNRAAACLVNMARLVPEQGTMFPSLTTLSASGCEVDVIALDSCRYESNWILSNAVGEMGTGQLVSLRALLSGRVNPTIVLLHHHVGWYEAYRRDARDVMMCAIDGRELLVILAEHASETSAPILVLHGHKHMTMRGVFCHNGTNVYVHGCPSSTLGNCATPTSEVDDHQYWAAVYLEDRIWQVEMHSIDRDSNAEKALILD